MLILHETWDLLSVHKTPTSCFLVKTIKFHIIHVHMSVWPKIQGRLNAYFWSFFSRHIILFGILFENSNHLHNSYIWSPFLLPSKAVTLSLNSLSCAGWSVQNASGRKLGVAELASCFLLLSRITGRYCLLLIPKDRYFIHYFVFKIYLWWYNILYELLNYAWIWNSTVFLKLFLLWISKMFQYFQSEKKIRFKKI